MRLISLLNIIKIINWILHDRGCWSFQISKTNFIPLKFSPLLSYGFSGGKCSVNCRKFLHKLTLNGCIHTPQTPLELQQMRGINKNFTVKRNIPLRKVFFGAPSSNTVCALVCWWGVGKVEEKKQPWGGLIFILPRCAFNISKIAISMRFSYIQNTNNGYASTLQPLERAFRECISQCRPEKCKINVEYHPHSNSLTTQSRENT